MGIWFGTTESKGPYGYVCTGLLYSKEGENTFALNKLVLVTVDMTLNECIELYAFLLDFDKNTMTGKVLGFDGLGKIFRAKMNPTEGTDADDRLIRIRASYINSYLNFSYYKDENGEIVCEYTPIWTQ